MTLGFGARRGGELPVEVTELVGRTTELGKVRRLQDRARLVTLTGPGGVGKSRIALRTAAEAKPDYADGVCLVELSELQDPDLLPHKKRELGEVWGLAHCTEALAWVAAQDGRYARTAWMLGAAHTLWRPVAIPMFGVEILVHVHA
jgi:hypothetical protein